MSSHLNRQDIANAAADPRPYQKHLDRCPSCRLKLELFQLARAGEKLVDAPSYAIQQARQIARLTRRSVLATLMARLTFDSWAELAPSGVRGLGPEKERRLRFEADDVRFDIRAEKSAGKWTMAAQVKYLGENKRAFQIQAGSKRISQRSDNFYIWSETRPPKSLRLVSPETTIVLPEIVWNEPLQK